MKYLLVNMTKRRRTRFGSCLLLFLITVSIEAEVDTNVINIWPVLPPFARSQITEDDDLRADFYNEYWLVNHVPGIKDTFLMVGNLSGTDGKGLPLAECPTVESALLKYAEPGTIGRHQIRLIRQNLIRQTPLHAGKDDPDVQAFLATKLEPNDVLIISEK